MSMIHTFSYQTQNQLHIMKNVIDSIKNLKNTRGSRPKKISQSHSEKRVIEDY